LNGKNFQKNGIVRGIKERDYRIDLYIEIVKEDYLHNNNKVISYYSNKKKINNKF